MWGCNEYVKFFTLILIFINVLVGLLFVGWGLYVVFLPWGDTGSYQAIGICLTLFGSAFTAGSMFGYLSVQYQLKRFGGGWTGRSAIIFYDVLLLILLGALIVGYIYGNQWLTQVDSAVDDLEANPASDPSYSMPEGVIRDHFNRLFFTASDSCSADFVWFWSFMEDICPPSMQRDDCQTCNSYGATFCGADEFTCYGGISAPSGQSYGCPYVICREGYLRWFRRTFKKYFNPVLYACMAITLAIVLLSLMLVCFDNTQRVVVKVSEPGDGEDFVGENPSLVDKTASAPLPVEYQPIRVQPPVAARTRTPTPPVPSDPATTQAAHSTHTIAAPPVETVHEPAPAPIAGTMVIPPPLTLSQKSIDLDTENAIIDSYIAMSQADSPGPGAGFAAIGTTSTHSKQHSSYTTTETFSSHNTVSASDHRSPRYSGGAGAVGAPAGRSNENSHRSPRYDGRGGGGRHEGSYEGADSYHRTSRRHQSQDYEYEQRTVRRDVYDGPVERSPRHSYNSPRYEQAPMTPNTADLQLEIAIMESMETSNNNHRRSQPQPQRSQRQAVQDNMYQRTPLTPGGDVQMEIAMMESLEAQSREERDVERAIFESTQRKKQPIGIPTQLGHSPLNRTAPRYEPARRTASDSELDQAIIQSILENK